MGTHRFTQRIAAPRELVFRLWIDADRWPEWIGGMSKVTDVTGPLGQAGTRYTTWFGTMRSRNEVIEADPPRLMATRFKSALLAGETRATFEPDGDRTLVTQEFRTAGVIASIAGRIFATGSWRGSFQGELNEFAKIAEREARAAGT